MASLADLLAYKKDVALAAQKAAREAIEKEVVKISVPAANGGNGAGNVVKNTIRDLNGRECGMLMRTVGEVEDARRERVFYGRGGAEMRAVSFDKAMEALGALTRKPDGTAKDVKDVECAVSWLSYLLAVAEGRDDENAVKKKTKTQSAAELLGVVGTQTQQIKKYDF